ncbi:MAG: GAF domain-containing protein [Okeania sp. SIO3I5]|uniref:ATP-binding protein n=1 Tax=Okeania sp. SIO3I5 TaxID=2607805 RepID=UPI0013BC7138|nr:ATP-binding protein [Okeania sp. SIO3I5]NEQ35528.1 GAF domain-containing protein [Okeania sp. SIO3I5]
MNSKQLQRLLIFYSALGIFIISVLVAIISIFPLDKQLRINEESNLQSTLQSRSLAVEQFVSRAKDIAAQISSRTQAKRELEVYNRSPNNRNSAVSNLTRILTDALNQTEDVVGITRLDRDNQLVVQLGLPIPQKFWKLPIQKPKISNQIRLKNESYIIISQPIINSKKQQVGTDLVLFKIQGLEKIITDNAGLGKTGEVFLGTLEKQQLKLFLSSKNESKNLSESIAKALEKTLFSQESGVIVVKSKYGIYGQIIAFEPVSNVNWGLAIAIERQELYAPVNRQVITIGIVIIFLSLLGTCGMILLLHPLTDRVIIQTDELEQQLEEKNQALQELKYTQHQLLVEIRDRKQSQTRLQNQNKILIELAQNRAVNQGYLSTGIEAITEATAKILEVERVGIWLYDDSKNYLKSLDLYQNKLNEHIREINLNFKDYPSYFQAISSLQDNNIIAANDARNDPRTKEFSENYLKPLDIFSMLDAGILIRGEVVGVICIEKCSQIKYWTLEDEFFVRSIANLVSLTIEASDRQLAENALRKSEAQLRIQKQELQQTLQELKWAQTQIIQSEKMSSLGQMVAGVAHEINNPVNFIHGNIIYATSYTQDLFNLLQLYQNYYPHPHPEIEEEIEAIELNFLQEDIKKMLKSMKSGTERIIEIVKSLRIFSRLDEAEIKEVDIHEGIDSTLMILQNRFKPKPGFLGIEVIKEYSQLPSINCYAGQLNQVFMNIIGNAIDAIENAQSSQEKQCDADCIWIKTQVIKDNWVEILIADNGGGISEKVRSNLFEPFFTTKPVGKGTGLGLSISYQIIVEQHQGKLECYSELGKGTEFIIKIPMNLN